MRLKPVDSEMLDALGYDEKSHSLFAEFKTGGTYRYKNVPSFIYQGLLDADSIGEYMHKYVLDRFEHERVSINRSYATSTRRSSAARRVRK